MKILSYSQKVIVFPTINGNLIPGLNFFLVALLQVERDLCILNSTKLCQTRRLHSQTMNGFVIMTLLFLMYRLGGSS